MLQAFNSNKFLDTIRSLEITLFHTSRNPSMLSRRNVKILWTLGLLMTFVSPLPADGPARPKARMVAVTAPRVVASFNGTSITDVDLRKAAADDLDRLHIEAEQMNANIARIEHQILETDLIHLLADKLFEAEAAKQGITKETFLEKELQGKIKEPTQQDIQTFYESNKQRFNQPLDKVEEQIKQYLRTEYRNKAMGDLADRLKPEYAVKMLLPPLRVKVAVEGSPSRGAAEAPVTIVEFSDFQCKSCSQLSKTLHEITEKYGDKVRLVYRQFPVSQVHPLAEKAAEASLCGADQSRFWELHDLMFNAQTALKEEDLKAKAAELKLDITAFNNCLTSGKYAAQVKQEQREGFALGVATAPSFFINGRFFAGPLPLADISKTIDEEILLKSSGATPAAGQAAHNNDPHLQ